MTSAITLSRLDRTIALLTFDLPGKGANVLSRAVLAEFEAHLASLEQDGQLDGLILVSAKSGIFIAGADLREFVVSLNAPKSEVVALCRRGQELFRRLSTASFVTVAAIDGICVGGGAELASWCDRRIMTNSPRTEFGFPEVKLGLYPGWGGTVRAPRIVGLANAIELVTSGESIDGRQAAAMGLASDLVPAEKLVDAAIRLIRLERETKSYLADRQRWREPVTFNARELGFLGATASAMIQQETKGHYPAPAAALELMLETCGCGEQQALEKEAAGMAELFGSPINAALINVFFLTDRNKRDTGLDKNDTTPQKIQCVGVIGAGIMGSGIAAANLKQEIPVALTDASSEALTRGARNVLEEATYNKKTKGPDPQKALALGPFLSVSHHLEELADCELVVEAVVENVDVKKRLLAQLEPQLVQQAILASNTSTIPITKLADGLARPAQFCGLHFFNPVRRMKLVEVIRGKQTSDQTVATAVAYAKRLGKMPIVVNDGPGFLVNRLLFPYMNEAIELLSDGASMLEIDKGAMAFGMPMGPIALYDMVGLDTAMYAGKTMWEAFPDRIVASPVLPAMVKAGRLGQKSKLGFYSYQGKKGKAQSDAGAEAIVANYRRGQAKFTKEQIADRLILPMLLEATRVLEERLVRDVRDVDLGLVFGIGFPPFRGGLLFWADTIGLDEIMRRLEPLAHLGKRMQRTPLLLEMAKAKKKFYPK